jgi:FSR family fosmidomycin resistance protein-like MFS transporter
MDLNSEPEKTYKTNVKIILALTMIHFIGDFYSSFITPLLPFFAQKFSLSFTQVGYITMLSSLLAFTVQPTVGTLADRYRTRLFILGGPLLTIIFIPLTVIVPIFTLFLICIALGSIGSSMFHPSTAGAIGTHAGRNLGPSMSFYITGGTFAFALGPIFISYFTTRFGFAWAPLTMIFGLVVMVFLYRIIPVPETSISSSQSLMDSLKQVFGPVWKTIAIIWVIMALRSFISSSFMTYILLYYAQFGYSQVAFGLIVALIQVGGAASGLICGHLADRFGYKPLFFITHFLATPVLLLQFFVTGPWVYINIFMAGFFIMATIPLGVAMAQKLAPQGRSMISSLMMGLAWGIGSMGTPVTGKMGEIFSLKLALSGVALIPWLTLFLIYFLPSEKTKQSLAAS